MVVTPEYMAPGSSPDLHEVPSGIAWTPLLSQNCSFPPEIFREVMLNFIRNPNLNSNHLFRADISLDSPFKENISSTTIEPRITQFLEFTLQTVMIRTLIPRNMLVDKPMDQSCLFYDKFLESGETLSLVVYVPHVSIAADMPFYHPAVRGIGFLHHYSPLTEEGRLSLHYSFFDSEPRSEKLDRTAQHLLAILHKHGQGRVLGYVKKVHHDTILPQAVVQDTYARLKAKYARNLCQEWMESTDPGKHVFEDLGIAAFLIELWSEMYKDQYFPGFVDIGCGNGLLVHILLEEGFSGWGFDARRRKSWSSWSTKAQENLKELVLIPSITQSDSTKSQEVRTHDGRFPKGTFIVSNHADELIPWTPILATLSQSPFLMIPCCSHNLTGARFRAPLPKGGKSISSAYASLVAWVAALTEKCGWKVEKEMLRIPSTRNAALIGRVRVKPYEDIEVGKIIGESGGCEGWGENAMKLVRGAVRGH